MTFDLDLPVSIAPHSGENADALGHTELISGDDVVFVSPVHFRPGEKIRLLIRMGTAETEAECRAKVTDSRAAFLAGGSAFRTSAAFLRSPRIVKPAAPDLAAAGL